MTKMLSELDSSRVNEELDADDLSVRSMSIKEGGQGLVLFNEVMNFFGELIQFTENIPHIDKQAAWEAYALLRVDAFNCSRATYKLLLDGYYAQLAPLLRRIHECTLRMLFFQYFPTEAELFRQQSQAWRKKYPDKLLRQKLEKFDELRELVEALQRNYKILSNLTHVTNSAMVAQMRHAADKGKSGLAVGGDFDADWLHVYMTSLLDSAGTAVKSAARWYYPFQSASQRGWLDRFKKFEKAVSELSKATRAKFKIEDE